MSIPKFTRNFWNADHNKNFHYLEQRFHSSDKLRFLEIGSYEGYSAFFLCNTILSHCKDPLMLCIEPDEPNDFLRHNLKPFDYVTIMNSYSTELPIILKEIDELDLGYVDGDHHASTVLHDMIIVWENLKVGGLLLVDDYEMKVEDPWFYISHKEFLEHPRLNWIHPKQAVDAFMSVYKGQFEIEIENYQIGLRKTVSLNSGKNLNHGINKTIKRSLRYVSKTATVQSLCKHSRRMH